MAKTSKTYNLFSATSAFFLWGGWAFYVNSIESSGVGMLSGIAQGLSSFAITLLVVVMVTAIYNRISDPRFKLILPAIITVSCILVVLLLVHTAVGTPHILYTIAPSLSVAFAFCIATAHKLRRSEISLD